MSISVTAAVTEVSSGWFCCLKCGLNVVQLRKWNEIQYFSKRTWRVVSMLITHGSQYKTNDKTQMFSSLVM